MRKALAQNPNLLRTLIGMGVTLIFLLAYAVYGATISTEYFIYKSNSQEVELELGEPERYYDDSSDSTTWTWDVELNGENLTWVNLSASSLSTGAVISISNAAGIYSHPDLGDEDAKEFSCSTSCLKRNEHLANSTDGMAEIYSLTDPDPALRGTGTVYADSLKEATKKASDLIETDFEPANFRITVQEQGDRNVNPSVVLTQVNEELSDISQFEVDAATEFMWALAAVIGCFSMVLVPSFTVYFAARAKQNKLDLKLEAAKDALEEE
tara:strand:+ start:503 stop:1306 length:804 start_codon:yes stop_codon:yes gene_type:complete